MRLGMARKGDMRMIHTPATFLASPPNSPSRHHLRTACGVMFFILASRLAEIHSLMLKHPCCRSHLCRARFR